MKKVHLIMPMCGHGSRFFEKGFNVPKPLILIQGKPFFYWATKSLSNIKNIIDITFVVLQDHVEKYQIDKTIKEYFADANIIILAHVLNGAVLTCIEGIKLIKDDYPIIFNDCDHAFQSLEFENFLNNNLHIDGGLLTFKSNENKFSYIKYDNLGKIIGTSEKIVVSDDAICGAYYFSSKNKFLQYSEKYLKNCPYKEFFLSGVFNEMINDNQFIQSFKTDFRLSFGVPEEYENIKDSIIFEKI